MSTGLLLGLFASLAWGGVDVVAAIAGRRVGSMRVLVGSQLASVAGLALIIVSDPARMGPDAVAGILAGLPLGVVAMVAYLAYFTALRIGPVSIVSPVIVAYGGTTVVLAVLFRGETLLPAQAAGATLATAGVVLAALVFDARSLRAARIVGPGVLVAVVTMLLFAILTVVLADPIRAHGWLPVVLGSRISNAGSAVLLLVVARRTEAPRLRPLLRPFRGWDRTAIALVVAGGVFDIAAFAAYAVGLEVAAVWLVGLASSFGPVLAIAYAVWRLGERPRLSQWLGVALIGVGVVVLALAG
ncbi:MAG: DMT family transporter [Chloroflexota bacterium]